MLRDATPSNDRGVNPAWWKLRMEVLRVMHRPDEFELVALDYCVTYEVSPPSWDSARRDFKRAAAGRQRRQPQHHRGRGLPRLRGVQRDVLRRLAVARHELAALQRRHGGTPGLILGDGKEAIELLDAKLADADIMIISCARLIRIDFSPPAPCSTG